jgi:bacteriocin biosynthesis cyclodehydratase domain-containing protein
LFDRALLLLPLLVIGDATTIPARPALAPWCRLSDDGHRLLFEHGGTVVTLEGRAAQELLPRLLPLLDGTRAAEDVRVALGSAVAPAVDHALIVLAENQLLVDGPVEAEEDDPVAAAACYAAAVTRVVSPSAAGHALQVARVTILGSGPQADEIERQLRVAGLARVSAEPLVGSTPDDSFVIAAPSAGEIDHLAALNHQRLEQDAPWLQVVPYDGRLMLVGPLFLPHRSACRTCYVLRRAACSGYEEDFDAIEADATRASSPAPLLSIASGLAALIAIRWLTFGDPSQPGRFYALEAGITLRLSCHRVLRVPRCADCGPIERAVPSPWFEEST